MINQRKRIFAVTLWLLDLALSAASFLLAYHIRNVLPELKGHIVMGIEVYLWILAIMLPTWAILLPIFGVYSEPSRTITQQVMQLSKAIGFAWLVMAASLSFVNRDETNRLIVLLTLGINYIVLVAYRLLLFRLKKHGALDVRHVAVVGSGPGASEIAGWVEKHHQWGVRLIGIFDLPSILPILESGGVDELIIVADRDTLNDFTQTLLHCEDLGVTTRVLLNFFPHSIARMELHDFEGFPLLTFSTTPTNEALLLVKRVSDIVLSLLLLVIAGPFMLLTALLIKWTSPGAILFKQERCGLNGRVFIMYKFRSMVDNAEQQRFELEALNEMDGPVFKSSRDPRVTAVGKVIRRFSIDESPQFYNVLRGDMSLVGPRPPLPQEVSKYERWQKRRLSMKPGITCLWQISGRNEVGFEDWMKLDLSYIDNWSLLLDLKILLKTVPVVMWGSGAK